ncbi:MAG: hypothetical protein JWP41_1145 [Ramlibacter sp.]|nr:hypothetical protein [Ramlibacter sp.]
MVMFKARFSPLEADKRDAAAGQQQQQQQPPQPQPKVPPIEEERGPQNPVREPEPLHEPERAEAL